MDEPGGPGAPRPGDDRLESWKEIAAYLRRGARTVQRWEREEGLPVHRLQHDALGSVYAYRSELDRWWASRSATLPAPEADAEASVAVLPFADLSREQDQAYFCDGVAEEITSALGRVEGLRVAARDSAFRFRPGADPHEAARRLRVRALLGGSVRREGERVRVTVRLDDAAGYQLWTAGFDGAPGDIFAFQEEIARSVAASLRIALTPPQAASLWRPGTRDPAAYDAYLRGRALYERYATREVEEAIGFFARAAAIDPSYPQAHAGLADGFSYLYLYRDRSEAHRDRALEASLRAVGLDPGSAQAQASRGLALSIAGHAEEADRAFDEAVRLDPGLFEAHYFYARHAFATGDAAKALALYEKAIAARPEDYQAPLLVAQIYEDAGRAEPAAAARRQGIERATRRLELYPDDARALYMAANGLAALGEVSRAGEWAERARALRPDDGMVLYNVACVHALLGRPEDALACLEAAVRCGLKQRGWYEHDSNLDAVRDHPRFVALLRSL